MFSSDRVQMRRVFVDAWRKYRNHEPLEPLERLIAEVVRQHPEYHPLLATDAALLQRDFGAEDGQSNPFLHMGLHISLQEQAGSDRPIGIRDLYRQLIGRLGDAHAAEHRLMECLGLNLWEA